MPDDEVVHVSVLSGRAEPSALVFVPGSITHPLSVGSRGNWVVTADGVIPVHLYLAFDGQTIHVAAAAPNAPVLLAGNPVGPTWAAAPVPCELRFGGACLILRRKQAAQDDWVPSTMSDNGALWKAAQRAVEAARGPGPGGMPFIPDAPVQPGAYQPPNFGSTLRIVPEGSPPPPLVTSAPAPSGARAAGAPTGAGHPLASTVTSADSAASPETSRSSGTKKGYWRSASTVKKITVVLMPFALAATFFTLRDKRRPIAPTHVVTPTTVASAAAVDAGSPGASGTSAGATSASAPGAASPPASVTTGPALAGSAASSASSASSASASPASPASSAPSALAAASAGPAPSASGAPSARTAKTNGGSSRAKRTPEREALDAVAAGSYANAAKDYDALTAAHADNPSYSDAARILHGKSAHGH